MAKEKTNLSKSEGTPLTPRKRRKKKWPIVILLLLIIAATSYFFRNPILESMQSIPIINRLIPASTEKEKLSVEALSAKVQLQEREIEKLNTEKTTLESSYAALEEQNQALKQYETMYNEFLEQKQAWDQEVAKTNPQLFIEQFEKIYPDTAEQIYTVLKGQKNLSDRQKELSKTIEQMDEEQAANALEILITTDVELLQVIFEGMSTDRRAVILSEMSSDVAAQVIKLIAPEGQVVD